MRWGAVGIGALEWMAGVVQADLAGRVDGAAGLAGLLGQQPTAFGRLEQAALDLGLVEGAGGDEVPVCDCREPCGLLLTRRWSPRAGLTLRSRRSQRRHGVRGSSSLAVPRACHSQRS
jgi:hypothetical protein